MLFTGVSAHAKDKNESVRIKYELIHEVCEKGQCQPQSIVSGNEVLEMEKETDSHILDCIHKSSVSPLWISIYEKKNSAGNKQLVTAAQSLASGRSRKNH